MSCPNNCTDGWYVNPYTHKRMRCQYCLEKKSKEIKTPELREKLNLPVSLTNGEFIPDTVFSSSNMDKDSVSSVIEVMTKLVGDVSIGVVPEHSMLFNLGKEVHENNFLNPLLLKAYAGGISCVPIQTSLDIQISRRLYVLGEEWEGVVPFHDLLTSKICIVTIDAGETREGTLSVKGFMQLRAREGNPTIILTHLWNRYVRDLCSDIKCYNLATLYSVKYKGIEDKQDTQYIKNQFRDLM